jgi:hypothetical protein
MSKKILIDEDTLTIVLDALDFAGKVLAECREDAERYESLTDRLTAEMNEAMNDDPTETSVAILVALWMREISVQTKKDYCKASFTSRDFCKRFDKIHNKKNRKLLEKALEILLESRNDVKGGSMHLMEFYSERKGETEDIYSIMLYNTKCRFWR